MSSPIPVRACVFDAYGTLLDFASATERCRDRLGKHTAPLTALWRDKQLQYTWLRALQDAHVDFWQVTQESLDFALETLGLTDAALRTRLLDLYRELDCFAEVPAVLEALGESGYVRAILSNGTMDMLNQSLAYAQVTHLMDHVLSVDEVGVFKTDRRVYQFAVDHLEVCASEIAFISSNGWDAHAAADFGMQSVWCNRTGQPRDRLPGQLAAEISDLSQLSEHICKCTSPDN